jgi:hypothetical protein
VALIRTSYEPVPIQELTTSLCNSSHSCTLKMEAIRSSETSVLIRATRCHLPEDDNHNRTDVYSRCWATRYLVNSRLLGHAKIEQRYLETHS